MPTLTKEQIIEAMMAFGVKKEDAVSCLKANSDYSHFVKQLHEKDDHGIAHIMTAEDYEQLESYYNSAVTKTNSVMDKIRDAKAVMGASSPKVPDYISKAYDSLMKEYSVIKKMCNQKTENAFDVVRHGITDKVLQGSFEHNEALGGNMSSRFVMQVQDSNGTVRTGVFTKKMVRPEIVNQYTSTTSMVSLDGQLALIPGERIDSRNSAMSDIAELLGRKDLLAQSEDLRVEHNGKIMEGSFMNFVEGTDISHLSMQNDQMYFDMKIEKNKPFFTKKAAKDIFDLQILDLVCQNFDRHGGNMIYQYKQTPDGIKLDGIIGIDNDTSFGNMKCDNDESFNRLPSMDKTVVVTEQMADYIMSITPSMVLGTLGKYKIADKGKHDTLARVQEMQERIKNGMEFSNSLKNEPLSEIGKQFLADPLGKINDPQINADPTKKIMVVVPDKLLDKVNIREIGEKSQAINGDGMKMPYGVCCFVSKLHTKERQAYESLTVANEAKKLAINETPMQEKTRDTKVMLRNFAEFMKNYFIKVQDLEPKNADLKLMHHEIIGQMARIEKKARTLGDETQPMPQKGKNDIDLNRLALYCKDLKKKCAAFSLKFSELKADGKWMRSADKESLEAIQGLNADVDPMLAEIRARDEMELLSKNATTAKWADSIAVQDAKRRIVPEINSERVNISEQITNHPNDLNRDELAASVAKLMYFGTLMDNMDKLGAEKVDALAAETSIRNNLKPVTDMVKEYMNELPSNEAICNMLKPENFQEGFVAGFRLYANLVKEANKNQAVIDTNNIEIKNPEKKQSLREKKAEETLETAFPGLGIR